MKKTILLLIICFSLCVHANNAFDEFNAKKLKAIDSIAIKHNTDSKAAYATLEKTLIKIDKTYTEAVKWWEVEELKILLQMKNDTTQK